MAGQGAARPTLLLTGAAEGLGASIARTFAAAGHDIVGLARSDRASARLARLVGEQGGAYIPLMCDITQPADVADALRPHVERIDIVRAQRARAVDQARGRHQPRRSSSRSGAWRCLGAFAVSRAVLPHMASRGAGTILLTGATAGLRGGAKFAAFASAKFALRGLAQSLSREFGPQGIHVAHVVLDGLIDEAQTERRFGPSNATRMDPDAVARAYLDLARQHPSAWTHELDMRPYSERF